MNQPNLKTDGDSWQYYWSDLGVAVGLEMVREKSDGLHGELWIGSDDSINGAGSHVLWGGNFNISSPTARERTARTLAGKPGGTKVGIALWNEMLEYVCVTTASRVRQGEPVRDLADGDVALDVDYLLKPLLPAGQITAVFADGESGKGWLALAAALSLRLGSSLLPGFSLTRQVSTLYLDWETDEATNRRRLEYLCRGVGLTCRPPGIFYRHMTRALADDLSSVKHQVKATGAEMVVVDSAGPATGAELKESDPATRFMTALRQLGTTNLVLGHVSKATAQARGSERGRMIGSIFFELLARSTWEMRADPETQPIVLGLMHRKANLGARSKSLALRLSFDDVQHRAWFGQADIEEAPNVAEHAPLSERMAAALKRGKRDTKDLSDELQVSEATIRMTGRRGVAKGVFVQLDQGVGRSKSSVWGLSDA